MSDIPTREKAVTWIINPRGQNDIDALLGAYVDGILMTEAEWWAKLPDGDLYVFDATKGDEHYDRLDLVALVHSGVLVKVEEAE